MGRWIAIGRVAGWGDLETFTHALKETTKWRVDPRTTITSVTALEDGRIIAECHANSRAEFDAWLQANSFLVESISPITHIARTGDIWKTR